MTLLPSNAKPDERTLLLTLQQRQRQCDAQMHRDGLRWRVDFYVRDIVHELGMNENRACSILNKWTNRGWYDYGVGMLAGWLTPEGLDVQLTKPC